MSTFTLRTVHTVHARVGLAALTASTLLGSSAAHAQLPVAHDPVPQPREVTSEIHRWDRTWSPVADRTGAALAKLLESCAVGGEPPTTNIRAQQLGVAEAKARLDWLLHNSAQIVESGFAPLLRHSVTPTDCIALWRASYGSDAFQEDELQIGVLSPRDASLQVAKLLRVLVADAPVSNAFGEVAVAGDLAIARWVFTDCYQRFSSHRDQLGVASLLSLASALGADGRREALHLLEGNKPADELDLLRARVVLRDVASYPAVLARIDETLNTIENQSQSVESRQSFINALQLVSLFYLVADHAEPPFVERKEKLLDALADQLFALLKDNPKFVGALNACRFSAFANPANTPLIFDRLITRISEQQPHLVLNSLLQLEQASKLHLREQLSPLGLHDLYGAMMPRLIAGTSLVPALEQIEQLLPRESIGDHLERGTIESAHYAAALLRLAYLQPRSNFLCAIRGEQLIEPSQVAESLMSDVLEERIVARYWAAYQMSAEQFDIFLQTPAFDSKRREILILERGSPTAQCMLEISRWLGEPSGPLTSDAVFEPNAIIDSLARWPATDLQTIFVDLLQSPRLSDSHKSRLIREMTDQASPIDLYRLIDSPVDGRRLPAPALRHSAVLDRFLAEEQPLPSSSAARASLIGSYNTLTTTLTQNLDGTERGVAEARCIAYSSFFTRHWNQLDTDERSALWVPTKRFFDNSGEFAESTLIEILQKFLSDIQADERGEVPVHTELREEILGMLAELRPIK